MNAAPAWLDRAAALHGRIAPRVACDAGSTGRC